MKGETRVEILTAEPRTSSALSGYGADCETERKSKPRSALRKMNSAQHLQIPSQTRKPVAPSSAFPVRTTSKQHRFQGLAGGHQRSVHHVPTMPIRVEHPDPGANQYTQRNGQLVEVTRSSPPRQRLPEANTKFPNRASSRQQVVTSSSPVPGRLSATTREVAAKPLQEELGALPLLPSKDTVVVEKRVAPTPTSERPQKAPLPPASHVSVVVTTGVLETAKSTSSPPDTLKIPSTQAEAATAETSRQKASAKSSSISRDVVPNGKPVQPARVDSGVSITQDRLTKPLPTLDRSKATLDGSRPKSRRQSGDELASWLAISSMLDRL